VLKKSEMNGIWQFWRNNESNETDELTQSMRAQAQLRKNIARQFRLRSFSTQSGIKRDVASCNEVRLWAPRYSKGVSARLTTGADRA
jgi:hypothetical protein